MSGPHVLTNRSPLRRYGSRQRYAPEKIFGNDTNARFARSSGRRNESPLSGDGHTRTVDTADAEGHWTMLMEQSLEGDCAAYHRLLTLLAPALRRALRARAG